MLSLLLACAFVQPEPPIPTLEPDAEAMDHIDRTRARHLSTDAGAEFWRAIDAHGGMLRWERVAPLVPRVDGRPVAPDDALYPLVAAPFAQLDDTVEPAGDPTLVRAGDVLLQLDEQRRVVALFRGDVRWAVHCAPVERLCLPHRLEGSDGTRIEVAWDR